MLLSYGTYARKKCDTVNEIQNIHKSLKQVQIHPCIGEVSLKWNTRKNVLNQIKTLIQLQKMLEMKTYDLRSRRLTMKGNKQMQKS